MKYVDYITEVDNFAKHVSSLSTDELAHLIENNNQWLCVIADVTCETEACPHGTQRVTFLDMLDGEYSSWCGNCNTQNFKIMGIFDDGQFELKPKNHIQPDDPWEMNRYYVGSVMEPPLGLDAP